MGRESQGVAFRQGLLLISGNRDQSHWGGHH